MTARILDGKSAAAEVSDGVADRSARLKARGLDPQLALLSVGESEPAELYATRLDKLGTRVGVITTRHQLPQDASSADLKSEIERLNRDRGIHGILVQFPLPSHIQPEAVSEVLDPGKDVDGISIGNNGRLYLGLPAFAPSTASAILQLLDWGGIDPKGKRAVIVGRSNVVGRPVAELLLRRHATVTICHTRTQDLAAFTQTAEILVAAAGVPRMITGDMVETGVVIADAGINVTADGLVGDVDFESCEKLASAITPVPGGVGPVTNAVLLRHVVESAERAAS